MSDTEVTFLRHEPCPSCGSRNNLARYSDGHAHCFGCEYYEHGGKHGAASAAAGADDDLRSRRDARPVRDFVKGEVAALKKRRITEETCAKWGYQTGEFKGKTVQIANYRDPEGSLVGQKIRFPDKSFTVVGKLPALYGQWLWRDKGKMVVVTEGEIDALTVSQLQGNKWPVVSIPQGAQGAKKAIAKALDWLMGFDAVVFMFDNDDPGRKAAAECAEVLPPGRAKIASLPLKDASDMMQAGRGPEVIDAIWGAKVYRPDGVICGADLWDAVRVEKENHSIPYPWAPLNEKTHGMRQGELVTWTAGSGVGKSAVVREIAHFLLKRGETVGMLMLEENTKRTALGLMGIEANKPLHLSREGVTEEQLKAAFDATLGTGRMYLYDHFGSTEIDNLLARVRYLIKGCGARWVILDHLSIVVSGMADGDERRLIDNAMTSLRTLVEETGVGLHLVSHLKRPEGKGHEEGARTSLGQLRGSAAIGQLSDMVVGLERDQQSDNPNITTLRVLKNRFSGETGEAGYLEYDRETGRLHETEPAFASEGGGTDDTPF